MCVCTCCTETVDQTQFYLPLDVPLMLDMFSSDILFLGTTWSSVGRPIIILPVKSVFLGAETQPTCKLHICDLATCGNRSYSSPNSR